jgi:hypothetical protein
MKRDGISYMAGALHDRYISTGAYEIDEFYHYGLALDMYTHFTYVLIRHAHDRAFWSLAC